MSDIMSGDPVRMRWDGITITTKSGEERVVNAFNIPVPDKGIMISTVTDATESVKKTQEVEALKNVLNAVLDATEDHIWAIDAQGNLLAANTAFRTFMKTMSGAEPAVGQPLVQLASLGSEKTKRWENAYRKIFTGETANFLEGDVHPKDGHVRYSELTLSPMQDTFGKVVGVACFVKNVTHEVENRKQLEQARDELQQILDSAVDVICTSDAQGKCVKMGAACKALFGYEPGEMEGKHSSEFTHPDDMEKTLEATTKIIAGERQQGFENRWRHKDGHYIPVVWTGQWHEGTQLLYCTARDARPTHQTMQLPEAERRRYERIFQNAPAFICAVEGSVFTLKLANREFSMLTGAKNLQGLPLLQAFPWLQGSDAMHIINQIYSNGSTFEANKIPITIPATAERGEQRLFVSFMLSPNRGIDGKVEGVFLFGVNITELVNSKREAQFSNERYAPIARATFEAVWEWDPHTNLVDWGDGFEGIFGHKLPNKQSPLTFWSELIHPDESEAVTESIVSAVNPSADSWQSQYRFRRADGTYAMVIDKGIILRNHRGEAERMVGAMQDGSELHRLEQLLSHTSRATRIGAWDYNACSNSFQVSSTFREMLGVRDHDSITIDLLHDKLNDVRGAHPFAERLREAILHGTPGMKKWRCRLHQAEPCG